MYFHELKKKNGKIVYEGIFSIWTDAVVSENQTIFSFWS